MKRTVFIIVSDTEYSILFFPGYRIQLHSITIMPHILGLVINALSLSSAVSLGVLFFNEPSARRNQSSMTGFDGA